MVNQEQYSDIITRLDEALLTDWHKHYFGTPGTIILSEEWFEKLKGWLEKWLQVDEKVHENKMRYRGYRVISSPQLSREEIIVKSEKY